MHLHDAQRALQQFAQTGARYLLTNVPQMAGSRSLMSWTNSESQPLKQMISTNSIMVHQER